MAAWCVLFRRRDLALEYYGKMLELDPGDPLALASIAFQTAQLGRKREALAVFDRLLAVKPGDAEAHFNRGFLLQDMNDHEGAMAAFRRAIALNPEHDRAHYGLALSLISTRRLEEALAPLKKNTKLQPMSPYGWYQLARVQHELGRIEETQRGARPSGQVRAQGRAAAGTGNRTARKYIVMKRRAARAPFAGSRRRDERCRPSRVAARAVAVGKAGYTPGNSTPPSGAPTTNNKRRTPFALRGSTVVQD